MIQARKKQQLGVTLVELMVAVTIGMIIMAGVMQIYMANKQTYRVTEALSRLQENGRFATHFLVKDIRKAGYQGCRSRTQLVPRVIANAIAAGAPDLASMNFDTTGGAFKGVDNVPAATVVGANTVLVGTDILDIQFGGSCSGYLTGNMTAVNANIQLAAPNDCNLQANWPFMISDCESVDIARASSVAAGAGTQTIAHAANVNIDLNLSKAYQSGAEILTLQSFTFYLAENGSNVPSFYRHNNATNVSEELVEGVDDLQFLYGEDTDGSGVANYYVPANKVADMDNIVSVRMTASVRTIDDRVSQSANTIIYNGGNITDHRIRKTFTTTIAIRNR